MVEQTYSTSQLAKIIGVHPNTVRMYEELGLIPKAIRKSNGYRVFSKVHIDQFRLARTALQIEVLQSGLRKKIISAVKTSALGKYDDAIEKTKEYWSIARAEIENANEAVEITKEILKGTKSEVDVVLKRKEVSELLGVTMDTLRNWEMNGLLEVKRKENGYRIYNEDDVKRLKIIRALRCSNYSLSSILRLLHTLSEDEKTDIEKVLNTPEEDESIISVCDKLIISLEATKKNAEIIISLLQKMKISY